MRITREKLIELARTEAERRAAREDVISAYVIGSVASGEPREVRPTSILS